MRVLLIKVLIGKKSGNLFNDPRVYIYIYRERERGGGKITILNLF